MTTILSELVSPSLVSYSSSPSSSSLDDVSDVMWIYVSPVIIVAGVVGNLLTIALMSRNTFKGFDMKPYFNVLAISDTCLLLFGE